MDIYAYDNYRVWLRAFWQERKLQNPRLTWRSASAQAGFSNPGFLNDVMAGRRHLSATAQTKIVQWCSLKDHETEFLSLLVAYDRAKSESKRQALYQRILFRRNRSNFMKVDPARSRYYQDFRYPLLRGALEAFPFRGNYAQLGEFLNPPLPPAQVRRLVRDLCAWGLVVQDRDGHYRVTDRFVEPSPHQGELIRRLNQTWIRQGIEALERIPPAKRHISTMLLNVSHETAHVLRQKVEAFREEIFALMRADNKPECVLQLSLLFFAHTRPSEE